MKLGKIAFRNLARNRRRTFFSIFTIVIAGLTGLFMLALISGMKDDMKKNIVSYYTGSVLIRNSEYEKYEYLAPLQHYVKNEKSLRSALLQVDGVVSVLPRITVGGKIFIDDNIHDDAPGEEFTAMAMGIDFDAERDLLDPKSMIIPDRQGVVGKLPQQGSREVAIGAALARKCGLAVGDKFSYVTQTATFGVNAMTFTVTAVVKFSMGGLNSSHFLVPFKIMQYLVKMENGAKEILVVTENIDRSEVQYATIASLIENDARFASLSAKLWKDQGEFYAMMGMGEIMYNFIALFFLVMGATVIVNTTMMAIYERYQEIGVMAAMGMRPNELLKLFFLESLFASAIASVLTLALGIILIKILEITGLHFGAALDGFNIEMSSVLYPKLKWYQVVSIALYTMFIPACATLIPCRKATQIQPIEAIKSH